MKRHSIVCDGCGVEGMADQGKGCKWMHQLRFHLRENEGWHIVGSSGEDYCPKCKDKHLKTTKSAKLLEQTLFGDGSQPPRPKGGLIVPHSASFSKIDRRLDAIENRLDRLEEDNNGPG